MKQESISLKDFRAGNFITRSEIKEYPILLFLKKNKRAYTVNAIVKATKMNKYAVRGMIRKLKKLGRIEHKSPFFAFKK